MSQGQPGPYQLDLGLGVIEQLQGITDAARQAGKLAEVKDIWKQAWHRLRTDPSTWGDPEFRAKTVDAVMRHSVIRPISFRFAVYEQARVVMLLRVRQFDEFD